MDAYVRLFQQGDLDAIRAMLVKGRAAMLVFDQSGPMEKPAHFVLLDWREGIIVSIRDFLFASYAVEALDWARLG